MANLLACKIYLITILRQRHEFAKIPADLKEAYKYQMKLNQMFTMIFISTAILYVLPWTLFILADDDMLKVPFLASWWGPHSYPLVMAVNILQVDTK